MWAVGSVVWCRGAASSLPLDRENGARVRRETSWYGLLAHIRRLTSTPGADERFQSDTACVASACCAIRRHLARRGIHHPRQLCKRSDWSQRLARRPNNGSNLFEETCLLSTQWPSSPGLTAGKGCRRRRKRCYRACLDRIVTHKLSSVTSAGVLFVAQHHTGFGSSSSRPMAYCLVQRQRARWIGRRSPSSSWWSLVTAQRCLCRVYVACSSGWPLTYAQPTSGWNRQTVTHSHGTLFCSVMTEYSGALTTKRRELTR